MKNSEQPAYPLQLQEGESGDCITKRSPVDGLTKREYFAGLAMQGICSSMVNRDRGAWDTDLQGVAVKIADALLKELEIANG